MNGKTYEGLTLPGLAAHIASSILLWNHGKGMGTRNDCKHAIAHNVRAYQRRMIAEKVIDEVWITDAAAAAEKSRIELEHAIPVGCLMNLLFHLVDANDQAEAARQVADIIQHNTVLVWVTKDEHSRLNKAYQCTMPEGFDTYPWKDPLARYRQTDGISELNKQVRAHEKSKPADDDLVVETEADFTPSGLDGGVAEKHSSQ